jgi:hypothetical protein
MRASRAEITAAAMTATDEIPGSTDTCAIA